MTKQVMYPTTAVTIFSILGGLAGGLGAMILSKRLEKSKGVNYDSVILASLVVAGASVAAVYMIKASSKAPEEQV